ncbi:MAG: ATP-binding protein [Bacteroidia bacterium]
MSLYSFPKRFNYIRRILLTGFFGLGIPGLMLRFFDEDVVDPMSVRLIPMTVFLAVFLLSYRWKDQIRKIENAAIVSYLVMILWLAWVIYKNHLRSDYAVAAYLVVLIIPVGLFSVRDVWLFIVPATLILMFSALMVKEPETEKHAFFSLLLITVGVITPFQINNLKNKARVWQTEKRLTDVFHASKECIWEIGKDHHFIFVSDRANEILGYTPEELYQMTPYDFVKEEERGMIKQWLDYISSQLKEMHNVEYQAIRKDGEKIWLEITGVPFFDEKGKYQGYRGALMDITGRKTQQKKLIEAKERAEEAVKARSQFLSVMSHEIRTPMNAVLGTAHLLMQESPREDQLDNLETLHFSAENLLVIINDILDYSKIEAGKIEFEKIDYNLKTLTERIVKSLAQKASEKNLQFVLKNDPDLPEYVKGDPTRLSQILTNLINNAIKFTEKGEVSLCTKLIHSDENTAEITFSVSDTGIGIPRNKIEHIFESFTQASSDTTRIYGGTGLGLAICKRLVELQGSALEVESEPGKGSSFFFTLKIALAEKTLSTQQSESQKEDFQDLGGVRILLVEDNQINQKIASKFLAKWGVVVDIADNGRIALEMIGKAPYALVLMDLQMPEMDGYEAARKIREMPAPVSEIPIIALTASAMNEVQGNVAEAGMNGYASKPFNPRELYRKIVSLLPLSEHVSES